MINYHFDLLIYLCMNRACFITSKIIDLFDDFKLSEYRKLFCQAFDCIHKTDDYKYDDNEREENKYNPAEDRDHPEYDASRYSDNS